MPVKIEAIGHCAIAASDIEAMARFYQNVLGFEILERDPDHGGVFLNLEGTSHTTGLRFSKVAGPTKITHSRSMSPRRVGTDWQNP